MKQNSRQNKARYLQNLVNQKKQTNFVEPKDKPGFNY